MILNTRFSRVLKQMYLWLPTTVPVTTFFTSIIYSIAITTVLLSCAAKRSKRPYKPGHLPEFLVLSLHLLILSNMKTLHLKHFSISNSYIASQNSSLKILHILKTFSEMFEYSSKMIKYGRKIRTPIC